MPVSKTKPKKKPAKPGKKKRPAPLLLNKAVVDALMAAFAKNRDQTDQTDPVEAAQDIMYDAWDATDRKKRIALAKKALTVSPNCADAYVLLGMDVAKSPEEALALFQKGVDAGRQALGSEGFAEFSGHFWGFLETRPFMRAMQWKGLTLTELGRHEQAIETYEEMLELNPNDNQGVRYLLASSLLARDDIKPLRKLLEKFKDDASAGWLYTQALLAFREKASNANELALEAWESNNHVPGMLSGKRRLAPSKSGYLTVGGADEATDYVEANGAVWQSTSGAIAWLSEITGQLKLPKQRGRLADK